jgi:hypothetical protein
MREEEPILASACKGEREVEKLKAIALRGMLAHLHTGAAGVSAIRSSMLVTRA